MTETHVGLKKNIWMKKQPFKSCVINLELRNQPNFHT